MDCDSNPCFGEEVRFIGSDATKSNIGPGATFLPSLLLISAEKIEDETRVVNIPEFLTFIETLTQPALVSIAQSHNIAISSNLVVGVIRNLISDHISLCACLDSSLPACSLLNSNFCGQDCDEDNLNTDFQSSTDLKIYVLSQLLNKLKLRPLHHILSQNNVEHDRNGSRSYLR